MMAMGIIGEYLGRLFMESKRRPLFLIDEYLAPRAVAGNVIENPTQAVNA